MRRRSLKNKSGFSLIEIMIVLGLIGVIVVFFASKITKNDNQKIRREVRQFGSDLRKLRNKARMNNITYRLVINIPENKEEKQSYWVEATSKKFLVTYDEEQLKKQKDELKEGDPDPSGFTVDGEMSKGGPQALPEPLFFESVEVAAQKKEYTSGRLYIHFFPEGRVEEAVIHIGDRKNLHWSLAIHPLTGQVDLITKDKKLKDMPASDGQK